MQKNNNNLPKDDSGDLDDYPLSTRFKARRAIVNAITQAKITDGTYDPEAFKCTRPRSGWLADWLTKKAD